MKTKQRLGDTSAKCERGGRNAERIYRIESKTNRLQTTFLLETKEKTVTRTHVQREEVQRAPPKRSFHCSSLQIDSIRNQSITTWQRSSRQKRAQGRGSREERT